MTSLHAKDFQNRSDLESYVRNKFGLTVDIKNDIEIMGTQDELAKLRLGNGTIFWGIRCTITNSPPNVPVVEKPNRGPLVSFGENGNRIKKVIK